MELDDAAAALVKPISQQLLGCSNPARPAVVPLRARAPGGRLRRVLHGDTR
jgi:hypothetical protein